MLVSIIIPVYNRAQSIRRAIQSILAQTYSNFEIIVIDDGSTDDLLSVLAEFPLVRLFRQSNQGVSSARNVGIKAAKGEWVAFLDSDDEWLPTKLAQQAKWIESHPDERVVHTDELWIRNGVRVNPRKRHKKHGGDIFEYCLPLCAMSPSSIMIHQDVFKAVGLFDEQLPACEDYDLWLRICSQYSVHFIDAALIKKYGGHEDQLSRKYWGMDRFRIIALQKIIDSKTLTEEQSQSAKEMLVAKLRVYMIGLKKRHKLSELNRYEKMLANYL